MKDKVIIDTNYYYDSSKPLIYEELKKLGIGAIVWCNYSNDWVCNVENEIKTIVEDFYDEDEIDLRGSFCCIGCLKETMNREKSNINVYELIKS